MPLTSLVSWVLAHPVGCCWLAHRAPAKHCWHVQWQVGVGVAGWTSTGVWGGFVVLLVRGLCVSRGSCLGAMTARCCDRWVAGDRPWS